MSNSPILSASNLSKLYEQDSSLLTRIFGEADFITAVDEVSMSIYPQETIGIIGESGCGKSTFLRNLLYLEEPTNGTVVFDGTDVERLDGDETKDFHRRVRPIFQDPFNAFNPKFTVEEILREPLNIHNIGEQRERIINTLRDVELSPPEEYLNKYPKQLSGGERQRVSVGRALIVEPDIILADEPVSMLDLSTQASILNLISRLTNERDVAFIYVSHDISTVANVCEKIGVMYLGRLVEQAPVEEIINNPKHPYTKSLIAAIPVANPNYEREFTQLEGTPPDPVDLSDGCRFRDRCPDEMDICAESPESIHVSNRHSVACHLHYDHNVVHKQSNGGIND